MRTTTTATTTHNRLISKDQKKKGHFICVGARVECPSGGEDDDVELGRRRRYIVFVCIGKWMKEEEEKGRTDATTEIYHFVIHEDTHPFAYY